MSADTPAPPCAGCHHPRGEHGSRTGAGCAVWSGDDGACWCEMYVHPTSPIVVLEGRGQQLIADLEAAAAQVDDPHDRQTLSLALQALIYRLAAVEYRLDSTQHPLGWIRALRRWSLQGTAQRIALRARDLGVANMAAERQKVWRWEHRGVTPDRISQLALAAELGVPTALVDAEPWPTWLRHAAPVAIELRAAS